MIRNYIKIALRHFKRNQITSLINIMGLALGLATCLVASLYIKHDLSADRFHENLNSIFRVTVKAPRYTMTGTPYLYAEMAGKEFPEVEETLRTADQEATVKINDELHKHEIIFADPNFLTFFTFPLIEGNRSKALTGLKKVVISDEMKQRYFPDGPALGKRIAIQLDTAFEDFEIAGVAAPTPAYSSMYFDFVVPLENRYSKTQQQKSDWGMFMMTTFLRMDPSKKDAFEKAMPAFVSNYIPSQKNPDEGFTMQFVLSPYSEHHLSEAFGGGGLRDGKNGQSLYVFGGIAIVILLLACFNFMNLTNAQSSKRAIEVGIKKVVGAVKTQLVRQFLAEALVMTMIAALLSLGLAELSLFLFRDLLQVSISIFDLRHLDIYAGLVFFTLITALLAGFYPAFVLANIQTLKTFKRQYTVGGSNWITRSILSLQFGISIILIVCAIVMWKQQSYISNKDLGFNREQVVAIKVPNNHMSSMTFLKNEIKALGETVSVTKTTVNFNGQSSIVHHKGKDNTNSFLYMMSADEDFFSTMEMKFVKGEGFKANQPSPKSSVIVNETLLKELNLGDSVGVPLGSRLGATSNPTIVGVVKDFHHSALKHKIGPLIILYDQPLGDGFLLARLAPGKTMEAIKNIEKVWDKTITDTPLEFSFLDDNVQKQYEAEIRWSTIITLATGMAIFLSVLGLVGLAMFTAEQRKKEIGIRKVLGASISQLVNLLSRDYVLLIFIAFVIAAPVSWYLMSNYWLNDFAYKIEMDVAIYVIALSVVLLIAGISVGSQTLRAALQNPADTLKEE
jgi:putative ABC transport system permease protein